MKTAAVMFIMCGCSFNVNENDEDECENQMLYTLCFKTKNAVTKRRRSKSSLITQVKMITSDSDKLFPAVSVG